MKEMVNEMPKPIIEVENLTKKYIDGEIEKYALDNVSLKVYENEFLVILGGSGSGKSTLLNIIGGMDNLDDGKVIVKGKDITKLNNKDLLTAFDNRLDVLFIDLYNKRKDSPLFNLDNFRIALRPYSDKLMQDIKNNADYEKQLERRSLFDDKADEEYQQFMRNRDWLPEHMEDVLRKQAPELIP